MHLPFLQKSSSSVTLISIIISDLNVAAAAWIVQNNEIKIAANSDFVPHEEGERGIVEACDVAISNLGQTASQAKQVLFGLPEQWVNGQTIANEKKTILRKVTAELGLESVGFVVTSEALIAQLRLQQPKLQAIVVFIEQQSLFVQCVVGGDVTLSTRVGRSDQIVEDITEAVSRMKGAVIPPRIILTSQEEETDQLESMKQSLLAKDWDTGIFPHIPSVEVVAASGLIEAVSVSGGREVAKSLGILTEGAPVPEVAPLVTQAPMDAVSQAAAFAFEPIQSPSNEEQEVIQSASEEAHDPLARHDLSAIRVSSSPFRNLRQKKIIFVLIFVLIVLGVIAGGTFAASRTLVRAVINVALKVSPVTIDQTLTVDASASASNSEQGILKAALRTQDESVTVSKTTTGQKTIGDKAKGKVTIYNRTAAVKQLSAGTVLFLNQKVKYTLDDGVTVASASSGSNYETVPGKAEIAITASDIGEGSNLAKDSELTVGTFDKSAYVAKTTSDITGGSSRTIEAVSDADQQSLVNQATLALRQKAQADLQSQVQSGEESFISETLQDVTKDFDAQVGEEAKTLNLTMNAKALAIVYTKNDLQSFLSEKLLASSPPGSTLQDGSITLNITNQQVVNDTAITIQAQVNANTIPQFDTDATAKVLAGKSLEQAQALLSSQTSLSSYRIQLTPSFLAALNPQIPTAVDKVRVTVTEQ